MTQLRLERLALRGYRNLTDAMIEPGPAFNIVHGDNGAGKSNILEAIYYLASLRSFRNAKTDDLIKQGHDQARLEGRLCVAPASSDAMPEDFGSAVSSLPRRFAIDLARGRARALKLDDKRPRSMAVWRTEMKAVLFHPGSVDLVSGSPELRRSYLDRILEQLDATYANSLAAYQKGFAQPQPTAQGGPGQPLRSVCVS